MRIALAQLDTTAGDIPGNRRLVAAAWRAAAEGRADLLVVPELALLGYPPRDLLLRESVLRAAEAALASLAAEFSAGPAAILGTVVRSTAAVGPAIANAAVLVRSGQVEATYAKRLLPTYDVFDERRYFAPGEEATVVEVAGLRVGLLICEDLWGRDLVRGRRLYAADPPADLAARGVDLVVSISASPYHGGKDSHRRALLAGEARRMGVPLVAVNLVGGNDDVLFDGRSRVFDRHGGVCVELPAFEPAFEIVEVDPSSTGAPAAADSAPSGSPLTAAEETRRALIMGLRGYGRKTGLGTALVGLSGGIDSAVVACLAVEAFGPEQVWTVALPGPFTAAASNEDAATMAAALRVQHSVIPIMGPYGAFLSALEPTFDERVTDVTEENLQARTRGTILMALSNKFGHLLLTTGNKSEVAVGYCTLYGDMNGGLAVISDVWKTRVYELARLYAQRGWIPARVLERPPSAELAPDQRDSDSLPPYDVLDRILEARIERGASLGDLVAAGEDPAVAERVLRMVERNEYKRRQMAPGLKVSPTAFGVGWRMPIARPVDLSGERAPADGEPAPG
ncbi:MAG: NAD+ synthase [Planctomycetota bacterium]|nr:NAD+ synthase [Planctomycetota bacterium]